jgi:hypothetical protein
MSANEKTSAAPEKKGAMSNLQSPFACRRDGRQTIPPSRADAGNQIMQNLLRAGAIQARLEIGSPGDPPEREADAAAERCGRGGSCRPAAGSCSGCRHQIVQRESAGGPVGAPQGADAPAFVRPKLSISQPADHAEAEADRMAEAATPGTPIPACAGVSCPEGGRSACGRASGLQRKAQPNSGAMSAPPSVRNALRSGGRPLEPALRAEMESSFGEDFSAVRVHTGRAAAASAESIQALAYTAGSDVVFGAGRYAPETGEGRKLLAHELAHVAQQRPGVLSRAVTPNYSIIRSNLTYGIVDWAITEAECDQVLYVLSTLSPGDFEDTVHRMQRDGLVTRLIEHTSETSRAAHATMIARMESLTSLGHAIGAAINSLFPPPAGSSAAEPVPEAATRAPESFDPCLVDAYGLTNAGLLSYYRRVLAVVNRGRDAAGYFDNRNLQRRLITERDRRYHLGHRWLESMPDSIPQTLYRLTRGPARSLQAVAVPGSTVAGMPQDISDSPLGTRSQLDQFLAENSIERIGASEYLRRTAPYVAGMGMAGATSGLSLFPYGMGGYRSPLLGPLAGPGFTLPGTRSPVPGAVFEEGVGILDYFAQPFELGYGRTITGRLAAGGTVPIDYPITFDIDEPLPVGDPNASRARQVGRALDPQNRQLLDWLTNRRTKGLGIDFRDIERGRNPLPEVSLADNPSAIITRRFGEVTELRAIFNQALAEIPNISALTPTQLKNQINRNIRDIIQNGRSPEGIAAREALRTSGFEFVPRRGIAAVRSGPEGIAAGESLQTSGLEVVPGHGTAAGRPGALRIAGMEGLRGSAGGGLIAVVTSGGIMIFDTAEHPEWARELAVSGALGSGGGFLAGSTESLIYQGGMRTMERSLAETGATSLTPGLIRGGSRLGGGAVGAMFVEGISMGVLEEREHFAPEITTRTVRSGLLGAGSVWAGGAAGAAIGSVVPVAGTAVGFVVGLIVGGVIYALGDLLVPGGRADWDAYEAGCHFRPSAGSSGYRPVPIGFCFTGETPVTMADGTRRRIDSLREGDAVLSCNERDGSLQPGRVVKIERRVAPDHLALRLTGNGGETGVTGEHPVHSGGLWLPAKLLRVGSKVTCLNGLTGEVVETRIQSVSTDPHPADVYDITVGDCHTFFADGILAHNKNI